ncbi:MAG: hypothetical protein VXW65_15400 [Pseudomonadota bacterium]|nr:hypothetical protein [Pseudomonadota bacterium]
MTVNLSEMNAEASVEVYLQLLITEVSKQNRQWVKPLRRIQRLYLAGQHLEAQQLWQSLLRPMHGSLHEFFVYCEDLDQMREVNARIDGIRERISSLLANETSHS